MVTFVTQGMVADKLATAIFTQIVLFIVTFIAVFLYLRTSAIRAVESYLYRHKYKNNPWLNAQRQTEEVQAFAKALDGGEDFCLVGGVQKTEP